MSTPLLTNDEQRAKLDSLLGHRFVERGQLMMTSTSDYNSLTSNEGVTKLAHEMCRWLGMKPNGLSASFARSKTTDLYEVDLKHKQITIDPRYTDHPYAAAGLLALAISHFFIEKYDHEVPDHSLIEFATIETGLGLWVANSLQPRLSRRQKIYHMIDGSWFHSEGLQLRSYSSQQYVDAVTQYAHDNRVAPESYLPHLLRRVRHLFPRFATNTSNIYLPSSNSTVKHQRAANLLWAKIILTACILASGCVVGIYAITTKSPDTSAAEQQSRQSIAIIKNSYDECIDKASEQQSSYDPNDIFMTRQIDATKSQCQSLRNEYNAAISRHDKTYQN